MKFRLIGFGAGLALIAGMATQAFAQVAQGSTFNISVLADADTNTVGTTTDSWAESQGATLNPYSHSLQVTDLNALGSGPLTAMTSASVSWVNAGKGSVSIFDTGWDLATTTPAHVVVNTFNGNLDIWTYTFLATADGTFDMTYDVQGFGDMFGLNGIAVHWSGPGGGDIYGDSNDPSANGLFSRAIVNGETYTVGIASYSNMNVGLGVTVAGSFDAQLDWEIHSNPVPEPFSIAGLTVGIAAFFRKKKKA